MAPSSRSSCLRESGGRRGRAAGEARPERRAVWEWTSPSGRTPGSRTGFAPGLGTVLMEGHLERAGRRGGELDARRASSSGMRWQSAAVKKCCRRELPRSRRACTARHAGCEAGPHAAGWRMCWLSSSRGSPGAAARPDRGKPVLCLREAAPRHSAVGMSAVGSTPSSLDRSPRLQSCWYR